MERASSLHVQHGRKVLMTLGKSGVPRRWNQTTFNRPSSRGHCCFEWRHLCWRRGMAAIRTRRESVKFSERWEVFIKTWGKKDKAPGEFETPHSMAFRFQRASVRCRPREPPDPNLQSGWENFSSREALRPASGFSSTRMTSFSWPIRIEIHTRTQVFKEGIAAIWARQRWLGERAFIIYFLTRNPNPDHNGLRCFRRCLAQMPAATFTGRKFVRKNMNEVR